MPLHFFQKGLTLLLKKQTSILSAALILMTTVVLSQILGLFRQRLLAGIFGASDTLGVYLVSSKLPDFLFQLVIAGALSSAFIPVFSDLLHKGRSEDANKMASTLMLFGFAFFGVISIILFILAPFFLQLFNLGSGYSLSQMQLMTNLMRIIIFGQIIFLIATFFSAILQSHNHFFIPGIAAALYNLGIIVGILLFSDKFGIYAPAFGVIIGAFAYTSFQIPLIRRVRFSFRPTFSLNTLGVKEVITLIWPRTLSLFIFQIGTILTVSLISFLPSSGRNYVILDFAQTLAFAPIVLFGQTIAQAAFPVLSREKDRLDMFRTTFMTSFNQMLYLVLPISVLFIVLRIPVVRLIFGAARFDWEATVLTGRTLAFFSLAIFAQALIYLVSRAFYALHDTKTPLVIGALSTALMLLLSLLFISFWSANLASLSEAYSSRFRLIPVGVEGIAFATSVAGIFNLGSLLYFLNKKIKIFDIHPFLLPQLKIFLSVIFMGFALYIPIKLLDQLVFDTTKTINLIFLTGISSAVGLFIYLFLTWLLNVKEAGTFLLIFRRLSEYKEIVDKSEKIIDAKTSQ
ncbi:MAG: murein biosynthesis integral membrane protein MurJ [Candidatus Levybacteria bacterium]|nr:murein biosynthesis integral membrane protein MurJ [Candidatus Levybacteria bacterium]